MNQSPVTISGMGAYTRVGLAGMGDLFDYFTAAGDAPEQLAGPDFEPGGYDPTSGSGFDWGKVVGQVTGAAKDIFTAKTAGDAAKKIYDLNIARAAKGLPPIKASDVAPQVNVGVSPDVKNLLMVAGGIAAGAWVISQLRSRRR